MWLIYLKIICSIDNYYLKISIQKISHRILDVGVFHIKKYVEIKKKKTKQINIHRALVRRFHFYFLWFRLLSFLFIISSKLLVSIYYQLQNSRKIWHITESPQDSVSVHSISIEHTEDFRCYRYWSWCGLKFTNHSNTSKTYDWTVSTFFLFTVMCACACVCAFFSLLMSCDDSNQSVQVSLMKISHQYQWGAT